MEIKSAVSIKCTGKIKGRVILPYQAFITFIFCAFLLFLPSLLFFHDGVLFQILLQSGNQKPAAGKTDQTENQLFQKDRMDFHLLKQCIHGSEHRN